MPLIGLAIVAVYIQKSARDMHNMHPVMLRVQVAIVLFPWLPHPAKKEMCQSIIFHHFPFTNHICSVLPSCGMRHSVYPCFAAIMLMVARELKRCSVEVGRCAAFFAILIDESDPRMMWHVV